jgi:hypothetical protein
MIVVVGFVDSAIVLFRRRHLIEPDIIEAPKFSRSCSMILYNIITRVFNDMKFEEIMMNINVPILCV